MTSLRVGLLGAGYMGQVHGRALQRMRGVEVCGVCDADQARGAALAAALGVPAHSVHTRFERMLDACAPDAVYICTPPFAHERPFLSAAARAVHVFIEKPIALTVAQGIRMARAAQAAGIITHVGYHMRYGAAVQRLKTLIARGHAGRPTLFDARYECNALHGPWWRDKRRCGGQVLEQAIHLYDLGLCLCGAAARVNGWVANLCHGGVPGYTVEDTSAAVIRFANGALGSIAASNCAVPMQWNNPFTVVCEKLTARFVTANEAEFVHTGGRAPRIERVASDVNMYEAETSAFIARLRRGGGEGPGIEDGLAGLRLVCGVLASARKGGAPVKV